MTFDLARQAPLLVGGFDGAYRADVWTWDGSAWTQHAPAGAGPTGRASGTSLEFGWFKPLSTIDRFRSTPDWASTLVSHSL